MNSIIKLTNGETIIGEIVHQDDTTTSVMEPLALEIAESDSGKPMMVALTWIPLTKRVNMVNLNTPHVVAVADVDEEINAYYEKSLAILKNDVDKLKEILSEEAGVDSLSEVKDKLETLANEPDPWMDAFGHPVETKLSANTVH